MIKYLVDETRNYHHELQDAIIEAREVEEETVNIWKCWIVEDTWHEVYHREKVYRIENYDGERKEIKIET